MNADRVLVLYEQARAIGAEIAESDVTFGTGLFQTLHHCERQANELAESLRALAKGLAKIEQKAEADKAAGGNWGTLGPATPPKPRGKK